MKKVLRIKWELVMLLLNLSAVGVSWFAYVYTKETNVLVMAIASLVCLIAITLSYKTISQMRKNALRMW